MTTGKMFFITASGFDKPMEEIPTEDFAVAKAEPRLQKTNAQVTPMKPKNAAESEQVNAAKVGTNMLSVVLVKGKKEILEKWGK